MWGANAGFAKFGMVGLPGVNSLSLTPFFMMAFSPTARNCSVCPARMLRPQKANRFGL